MIEHNDLERLDERYIKRVECVDLRTATDKRIDTIITDMAVNKTKLNILIGILSAIGVPVLAIAVKLLFPGAA